MKKRMYCKIDFDGDFVTLSEFLKECFNDFKSDNALSASYFMHRDLYDEVEAHFYWIMEQEEGEKING